MMNMKEFMQSLLEERIDYGVMEKINEVYGVLTLPEVVQKMVSKAEETIFFDADIRILSVDEILEAEQDLHVDFVSKGMIPLMDFGENDFGVYIFKDEKWAMFNIIDETIFKLRDNLEEFLE